METILIKLARFQYYFSGMVIKDIWGEEKYSHYGKIWVEVGYNLLDFFVSLDTDNRVIFVKYLEDKAEL